MGVATVTDTTHYMPSDVVAAHGIHLVSLYVNWPDGRQLRESEMPDFQAFYDDLRSAQDLPTTSQPSVGDFLSVYEPLLERGDEIVSVHLAATLSGTLASAEQARDHLVDRGVDRGRIVVVDADSCAAGHGQAAIAAANAARAGANAEQAAEAARRCAEDAEILFAVDTLEFLRRGGRIGAASAYLGTALKIKPILTFRGELKPIARVRTSSRALDHLAAHLAERREQGCDAFFVQHIQAPEQAERMAERGRELFGAGPEYVSEIGPVIGTHAGPGMIGVSAGRRELLDAAAR